MGVQSFSIEDVMPELVAGNIRYVSDIYDETNGLGGMVKEAKPQFESKIRVAGKVKKRFVAEDIPESSEATTIKDTKFTDEMFTAPEYGKGFTISLNDIIQNQAYPVNFKAPTIVENRVPTIVSSLRNASNECVDMIKRSEDKQVKDILDTSVIQLTNYIDIDFGRDANNSEVISSATLKWKIANASTMKPLLDIQRWTEQVATRGNSGGQEFIALMESSTTYLALINSEEWKVDSNQRRNFNIQRMPGMNMTNKNIPKGALYRYSLIDNPAGVVHIFTYDQTYTNDSGDSTDWLDANKVYLLASDNIIERQPVEMMTFDTFAKSQSVNKALRAMPRMAGWLITPEWNKMTTRAMAFGVYRKFLTLDLTPNKKFTATVNS